MGFRGLGLFFIISGFLLSESSIQANPVSPLEVYERGSGIAVILNSPILQNRAKSQKVYLDLHPCSTKGSSKKKNRNARCFSSEKRLQIPLEIGAVQSSFSRPPVYVVPAGSYLLKRAWWLDKNSNKRLGVNFDWSIKVAKKSVLQLGIVSLVRGNKGRIKALVSPFPLGLVDNNPDWPKFKKARIPSEFLQSQAPRLKLKRKYVDAYQKDMNEFKADDWDSIEVVDYYETDRTKYRSDMGIAPTPPKYDIRTVVVKRAKPRPVRRVAPPPAPKVVNYQIGVRYNVSVPRNKGYINPLLSSLDSESRSLQSCYERNLKKTTGIVRGTKWSSYLYQFRAAPGRGVAVANAGKSRPPRAMNQCVQNVLKRAQSKRPPSKLTSGVMQVRFDYLGQ